MKNQDLKELRYELLEMLQAIDPCGGGNSLSDWRNFNTMLIERRISLLSDILTALLAIKIKEIDSELCKKQ